MLRWAQGHVVIPVQARFKACDNKCGRTKDTTPLRHSTWCCPAFDGRAREENEIDETREPVLSEPNAATQPWVTFTIDGDP